MAVFDAISARLYPYNVDDNLITIACTDAEMSVKDEYTPCYRISVAKAAIDVLKQLIVLSSEGNGGYSLGYDTDMLRKRICALAKDNGLTDIAAEFDPEPQIFFMDL